jgi:S1-C subfamily serine protease
MRYKVALSFVVGMVIGMVVAYANTLDELVKCTWSLESTSARGTGTLFKSPKDGKWYFLTAGHCVEDLRSEQKEVGPEGKEIIKEKWEDAYIVQKVTALVDDIETEVGTIRLRAKVVAYSKFEDEDLALLEVYAMPFEAVSAQFAPPDLQLQLGEQVWHVGNLRGELTASLTAGHISAVGRIYKSKPFIQTTTVAVPGSSGGGIYVQRDGKFYYVGMITLGDAQASNINFAIPFQRIRKWLHKVGYAHVIGDKDEQ